MFGMLWIAEARPTTSSAGTQSFRQVYAFLMQLVLGSEDRVYVCANDQRRSASFTACYVWMDRRPSFPTMN